MSDEQIYGFMPFNHADRPVEAMVGETVYDYNGKVLGWIVSEQAIPAWNRRVDDAPEQPVDNGADVVAILRKYATFWGVSHVTNTQCDSDWEVTTMRALADMIERDYVLRDSIANDTPINEKHVPSLKESTEDTRVFTDSRERLEADVLDQTECSWVTAPLWKVSDWLNRQAAITERETVKQWEEQSSELVCKINELTAERDKWKAKRDICEVLAENAKFWEDKHNQWKAELETYWKDVDFSKHTDREQDTRENLKADIYLYLSEAKTKPADAPLFAHIIWWLDRQDAITERECQANVTQAWQERYKALNQVAKLEEQVDSLTAERDELLAKVDELNESWRRANYGWAEANAEAERWRQKCDELREKLDEKQRVIDVQRDSFVKMERECAELRQMLSDAAEAI